MKKKAENIDNSVDKPTLAMYMGEISHFPPLTREEEAVCARDAALGNTSAKNKLASANLRFVITVAKKYQGLGLPLEDLINEGNIGLLSAIEHFDVTQGFHFITYAVHWIRQSIIKAICDKSRLIRLPLNIANKLSKIEKTRDYIQGGESEIKELAGFLNMPPRQIINLCMSNDIVSLDYPLYNEEHSSPLEGCIEAAGYPSPEKQAVDIALHDDIEQLLKNRLTKKEADVIRFRYGLGNNEPLTLKETGDKCNLSGERVRQIEKKAIQALQKPSAMKVLEGYVA